MPAINIAKDDNDPQYIDSEDITGVEFHKDRTLVSVYGRNGALLDHAGLKGYNIDADDLLEKLDKAGVELVHFALHASPYEREGDPFVNPKAVTYVVTSKPDEDGLQSIAFGVNGMGEKTSHGHAPEEVEAFIAAVRAAKPLRDYKPEEAIGRWQNEAGALHIDPRLVTGIYDTGLHINVNFADHYLGVLIPQIDMNDIYEAMPIPRDAVKDGQLVTERMEAYNEATRRRKYETDETLRFGFVNGLAEANGTLVPLTGANYISRAEVAGKRLRNDPRNDERADDDKRMMLTITLRDGAPRPQGSGGKIDIYFHDKDKALAAFEALSGDKQSSPAPRSRAKPTP